MAEKLETIISRGDQNTRPRDFYDVYILCKLQSQNINIDLLKKAIVATSEKRSSTAIIDNYKSILEVIQNSEIMQHHWKRYQKDFDYAKAIEFIDICASIGNLMNLIYY